MTTRIVVDRDVCQGHGQCALIAPDLFSLDDNGELVLASEVVDDSRRPDVEDAADVCPTQALTIESS